MAISSNNVQVYTTLSKELVAEIDKDAKENFRTRSQQGCERELSYTFPADQYDLNRVL